LTALSCSTREVPQTPIDTSNYEQRVLDNIVQTAVKDFIDISQQTDMQEGSYDGSKEKLEMYMYVYPCGIALL
jgi:hypothetical protein